MVEGNLELGLMAMAMVLAIDLAGCSASAIFSSPFACAISNRIKGDVRFAQYGSLHSLGLVNLK